MQSVFRRMLMMLCALALISGSAISLASPVMAGKPSGVVRLALKRGHLKRRELRPLLDYRAALVDRAVALLSHRGKGVRHPERVIRATVQMAQATALDVLLNDAGTLRPGSLRMADMVPKSKSV